MKKYLVRKKNTDEFYIALCDGDTIKVLDNGPMSFEPLKDFINHYSILVEIIVTDVQIDNTQELVEAIKKLDNSVLDIGSPAPIHITAPPAEYDNAKWRLQIGHNVSIYSNKKKAPKDVQSQGRVACNKVPSYEIMNVKRNGGSFHTFGVYFDGTNHHECARLLCKLGYVISAIKTDSTINDQPLYYINVPYDDDTTTSGMSRTESSNVRFGDWIVADENGSISVMGTDAFNNNYTVYPSSEKIEFDSIANIIRVGSSIKISYLPVIYRAKLKFLKEQSAEQGEAIHLEMENKINEKIQWIVRHKGNKQFYFSNWHADGSEIAGSLVNNFDFKACYEHYYRVKLHDCQLSADCVAKLIQLTYQNVTLSESDVFEISLHPVSRTAAAHYRVSVNGNMVACAVGGLEKAMKEKKIKVSDVGKNIEELRENVRKHWEEILKKNTFEMVWNEQDQSKQKYQVGSDPVTDSIFVTDRSGRVVNTGSKPTSDIGQKYFSDALHSILSPISDLDNVAKIMLENITLLILPADRLLAIEVIGLLRNNESIAAITKLQTKVSGLICEDRNDIVGPERKLASWMEQEMERVKEAIKEENNALFCASSPISLQKLKDAGTDASEVDAFKQHRINRVLDDMKSSPIKFVSKKEPEFYEQMIVKLTESMSNIESELATCKKEIEELKEKFRDHLYE